MITTRKLVVSSVAFFLLGALLGASALYCFVAKSALEEVADQAYLNIGGGIHYAEWTRKGETQKVVDAAEGQMLRAMRRASERYPGHPGRGYWFGQIDRYYKEFQLNLPNEDRRLIDSMKGELPEDEKVFYHY